MNDKKILLHLKESVFPLYSNLTRGNAEIIFELESNKTSALCSFNNLRIIDLRNADNTIYSFKTYSFNYKIKSIYHITYSFGYEKNSFNIKLFNIIDGKFNYSFTFQVQHYENKIYCILNTAQINGFKPKNLPLYSDNYILKSSLSDSPLYYVEKEHFLMCFELITPISDIIQTHDDRFYNQPAFFYDPNLSR